MSDLSNLTDLEYIQLKATLHSLDNKQYKCSECLTQYSSRPDHKEMTERSRKIKGCFDISDRVLLGLDNGEIKFKTCIGNFFCQNVLNYLQMYEGYTRGILPFGGALADQPAKIFQVFNVIESYKHDKMKEEDKRVKLKQKR